MAAEQFFLRIHDTEPTEILEEGGSQLLQKEWSYIHASPVNIIIYPYDPYNHFFSDADLYCYFRGCLHDTGTSFIPVWNLISYHVYMGVILPEWHEVSCEPSFLQASLERCCLSTAMRYPS